MSEPAFDPVIHAPHRLHICAITHSATSVEFAELQDRLGISKSALSKHLAQLVDHGYLSEERITRAGRSRLQVTLTPVGRETYAGHIAALKEIIDQSSNSHF